MKKHLVLLAALLALQPGFSHAVEDDATPEEGSFFANRLKGLYFGINGGWNDLKDEGTTRYAGQTQDSKYDPGMAFSAVMGYAPPYGKVRTEFEIVYRKNDADFSIVFPDGFRAPSMEDTHEYSLAFMLNMYYDFKNRTKFTPFLGIGAGYAKIWEEGTYPAPFSYGGRTYAYSTTPDGQRDYEHSYWHVALQAGGGVSYAVTDHIDLEVKYLYFRARPDLDSHTVFGGIRFHF